MSPVIGYCSAERGAKQTAPCPVLRAAPSSLYRVHSCARCFMGGQARRRLMDAQLGGSDACLLARRRAQSCRQRPQRFRRPRGGVLKHFWVAPRTFYSRHAVSTMSRGLFGFCGCRAGMHDVTCALKSTAPQPLPRLGLIHRHTK
jgi:hypothetical protein